MDGNNKEEKTSVEMDENNIVENTLMETTANKGKNKQNIHVSAGSPFCRYFYGRVVGCLLTCTRFRS